MRANSNQESKGASDSACFILPDPAKQNVNFDREREQNDFIYNEANQSFIPLNRDTYDQFAHNNNYAKDLELEQKRKQEAE
jgi:hypothetical protein